MNTSSKMTSTNPQRRTARLRILLATAVVSFFAGGPLNVLAQQAPQLPQNVQVTVPTSPDTKMDQAANGTPVVQIAAPNAAGVSHNVYDQYNVDAKGQILNNSQGNVQTQLGGWIEGNPNLQGKPEASLILNEVTSTNPSVLNGYIEVAGRKADVVVANPNGITCDGCGFINTANATLTTGRPIFGGDGSLSAFRVEGGVISVQGKGLDAGAQDRIDLIARALQLNAKLWANQANAVIGANVVKTGNLEAEKIAGTGSAPVLGIDVSSLGGMYAQKIKLVGNENGVGVHSAGELVASQGDFSLDAAGDIKLANRTAASGNTTIKSTGAVVLEGKHIAAGDLRVDAASLQNNGLANAAGTLSANTQKVDNTGELYSGQRTSLAVAGALNNAGLIGSSGSADIRASELAQSATGEISSAKDTAVHAQGTLQSAGKLLAGQSLNVTAGNAIENSGSMAGANTSVSARSVASTGLLQAQEALSVTADATLANHGRVIAGSNAQLKALDITQSGTGSVQANSVVLDASGNLRTAGVIQAKDTLDARAARIDNTGALVGGSTASVKATDSIRNSGGIGGDGNVTLATQQLDNLEGGVISAAQRLEVNGSTRVTNAHQMLAGDTLQVNAGALNNTGEIGSQRGDVALNATGIDNAGSIQSATHTRIKATGKLTNSGSLVAKQDLTIDAGALESTGNLGSETGNANLAVQDSLAIRGKTVAAGTLSATAGGRLEQSGQTHGAAGVSLQARDMNLAGATTTDGTLQLKADHLTSSSASVIAAAQDIRATVGAAQLGGTTLAQRDVLMNVTTLANNGDISAARTADLRATGTLTNAKSIVAGDALTLQAGTLDSTGDLGSERGDVTLNTQGDLAIKGKTVAAGSLTAQSLGNLTQAGQVWATRGASLSAANTANIQGTVGTDGALGLKAGDLAVSNTATVAAAQVLDLTAQRTLNSAGKISGQSVTMNAGSLQHSGEAYSRSDLAIRATGAAVNSGSVIAKNTLTVKSGSLETSNVLGSETADVTLETSGSQTLAGRVIAPGTLSATAGGTLKQSGTGYGAAQVVMAAQAIEANGSLSSTKNVKFSASTITTGKAAVVVADDTLDIQAQSLSNQGALQGTKRIALNAAAIDNGGSVRSGDRLDIDTGALVNRAGASMVATNGLSVRAATLASAGELGTHTGDVTLDTRGDLSITGKTVSPGKLTATAGGALNQGGETYAKQSVQLNAAGKATLAGNLGTDGALNIQAGDIAVLDAAVVSTTQALDARAQNSLRNAGTLYAAGDVRLQGQALNNTGSVYAQNALNVSGGAITQSNTGSLVAGQGVGIDAASIDSHGEIGSARADVTLNSRGNLSVTGKTAATQGKITAVATGALAQGGTTYAKQGVTLTSGADTTTAGTLESDARVDITAGGALTAGARTYAGTDATLNATGALRNTGDIQATQITVTGRTAENAGRLLATGNVTLKGTDAAANTGTGVIAAGLNANGNVGTTGVARIDTQGTLTQSGKIYAGQSIDLTGQRTVMTGGELVSGGNLSIETAADIDNRNTRLTAANQLRLKTTGAIRNTDGLLSAKQLDLQAASLDNTRGTLLQTGEDDFNLAVTGALTNTSGTIATNARTMQVQAGSVDNTSGSIQHAGTGKLTLASTGNVASQQGTLVSNGEVSVVAGGSIDNRKGQIGGVRTVRIQSNGFDNSAGITSSEGNLEIVGDGDISNNDKGLIAQRGAAGTLTVQGRSIRNNGGTLGAEGQATLTAQNGAVQNASGVLFSGNVLTVAATQGVDNTGGAVQSKTLDLNAGSGALLNVRGNIDTAGNTRIQAGALDNTQGRLVNDSAANTDVQVQGALTNNTGVLGGTQGDVTLNANALANNGATSRIVAGRDLSMGASDISNAGGLIYATRNLNQTRRATRIENTGGQIGADSTATLAADAIANANGKMVATNLNIDTYAFNNINGKVSAADTLKANVGALQSAGGQLFGHREADITMRGDYTHTGGNTFSSNRLLSLSMDGKFTNTATLESNGAIVLKADAFENVSGAVVRTGNALGNSHTGVEARSVVNAGRIEGDTVAVKGGDVNNTGTLIGKYVFVEADSLVNGRDLGTTLPVSNYSEGAILATNHIGLNVANTVENRDALIYSAGGIAIAGKTPTARVGSLLNSSGEISAEGEMTIAASDVRNQLRHYTLTDRVLSADERAASRKTDSVYVTAVSPAVEALISANFNTFVQQTYGHRRGWLRQTPSATITKDEETIQAQVVASTSAAAQIKAGGTLQVSAGRAVENRFGVIAAGGNLIVNGASGAGAGANVSNLGLAGDSTVNVHSVANVVNTPVGYENRNGNNKNDFATFATDLGTTTETRTGTVDLLRGSVASNKAVSIDAHDIVNASVSATTGAIVDRPANGWQGSNPGTVGLGNTTTVTRATAASQATKVDGLATGATQVAVNGKSAGHAASSVGDNTHTVANEGVNGASATVNATTVTGATGNTTTGPTIATSNTANIPSAPTGNTAPQVIGGAADPLAALNLPNNGLFTQSPGTGRYQIVTDPRFASYGNWLGSDYMMKRLGLAPDNMLRRLGDDYYEQWLVTEQITGLTGRKYLAATSSLDQYRDLMDAGVRVAGKFSLSLGIALTEAQIAALDEDIVWMVEKTIGGEKLLVPVVYLSAASANKYRLEGATIAANDVYLNATGTVTNHGNIQAGNTLAINARDLVNSGALTAGGVLYANASNDIINRNGTLTGGTVQLVAGNDVLSKTQIAWGDKANTGIHSAGALTINAGRDIELAGTQVTAKGTTTLDAGRNLTLTASQYTGLPANAAAASVTSSLNTTGDALLTAKQDLTLNRSTVNAGGTAALIAGRDLTISSGAGAINATTPTTGGAPVPGVWLKGHSTTTGHGTEQQLEVAGVNAGSQLVLSAGRDAHLNAAQVTAGEDLTVIAKRDINASTVATTDTHTTTTVAKKSSGWITQVDQTAHGTLLGAQGNVTLNAGQDVSLQGASVNAKTGEASISAVRDVNLTAAQETHETHSQTTKKSGNFWNDTETRTFDTVKDSIAVGTTVSGETVKIKAGNDVLVQGGQVVGTKDVAVTAGNDLLMESAQNNHQESHSVASKSSNIYAGIKDGVARVGYSSTSTQSQAETNATSQAASSIASLSGNVSMQAGRTMTVAASEVIAKENLTLSGADVRLQARQDIQNTRTTLNARSSGASLGVTVNGVDAYKSGRASTKNGDFSQSTIGKAMQRDEGITEGTWAATQTVVLQSNKKNIQVERNVSSSTDRTANLAAGKNLVVHATEGSITSQGSQLSADGDIKLTAKQGIDLGVARSVQSQSETDHRSGNSVATNRRVGAGNYNDQANGNGDTTTAMGTQISAGGSVDIATEVGDITLTGAQLAAQEDVNIQAARNLVVQSAQNTVGNVDRSDNRAIGAVVISDTERFMGYHTERRNAEGKVVSQVASNIGSLEGNVNLSAGGAYNQSASNVVAAKDVSIRAKTIELSTAKGVETQHADNQNSKYGVFARVNSPLIDLVNNVESARKSDGRVQTMQGMAAAANAYQAASAISSMAGNAGSGSLISAEAGIGFAKDESRQDATQESMLGSSIAGRNVTLATTEGDLHVAGAALKATNTLTVDSARNIVLEAGKSRESSQGHASNSGAEVGVGVSVGAQVGYYVYAQASAGSSNNSGEAIRYDNTRLTADTINLKSGADTTLSGAAAHANTINADVSGKLAIQSLQDEAKQNSKSEGYSARVQVSFGTAWSASGSANAAQASGSSSAVREQSGLFAGSGGYHVTADQVNLVGGAITSTNAANSELTANGISFSNLYNKMNNTANAASISGGYNSSSDAAGASDQKNTKSGANFGGGVPMSVSGKDSSTTYATLTEGAITIGGQSTTAAELGLHTDATTANTAIAKLPDIEKIMADQKAMSAAAGTVIAASQQLANDRAAAAQKQADKIGDDVLKTLSENDKLAYDKMNPHDREQLLSVLSLDYANALANAKSWGAGGEYGRALNAVTTAVVGAMAGHSDIQIASNALAPYASVLIGKTFDDNHGKDSNTGLQLLAHALLGAYLSQVNGGNASNGALAGAGGELAAQYISQKLYGTSDSYHLDEQQKQAVVALSQAVVALASGASDIGGNNPIFNASIQGNIARNAAENNWGEVGHYSTFATVLYLAGFSEKDARAIALSAWSPDTDNRNAVTIETIPGGFLKAGNQQQTHLLDGETNADTVRSVQRTLTGEVAKILGDIKEHENDPKYKADLLSEPRVQQILHSFGDSFAHVRSDGSHYDPVFGHLADMHKPDEPNNHPDAYRAYVMAIYDAAGGTLFDRLKISRLSDIVVSSPSDEGQKAALQQALRAAGLQKSQSVVEAPIKECKPTECPGKTGDTAANKAIRKIYGL